MWKYFKFQFHNLSPEHKKFIHDNASAYRWCYNWGLEYCNKYRKENNRKTPTIFDMNRAFTELLHSNKYPWLLEYDSSTCKNAFIDVHNAFKRFFSGQNKYPRFKSKKTAKISFHARNDRVRFVDDGNRYLRLPKCGKLRFDCKNNTIPTNADLKNVRISFDGLKYWISGCYEIDGEFNETPDYFDYSNISTNDNVVGIDVGKRTSAMLSNGISFELEDKLKKKIHNLDLRKNKLQSYIQNDIKRRMKISEHTRTKYVDIPKSQNQKKREIKYLKMSRKIHNILDTHYHQVSSEISKMDIDTIVLEDLKVRRMKQDHFVSLAINNLSLSGFINKISYKCRKNGINVVKADEGFKSTQICSNCGIPHKVYDSKIYRCPYCGLEIDRDLNAAFNLRDYVLERCSN